METSIEPKFSNTSTHVTYSEASQTIETTRMFRDASNAILNGTERVAHRLLLKLVSRQPNQYSYWTLLGLTVESRGAAHAYFERALAINPNDASARQGLEWASSVKFGKLNDDTSGSRSSSLPAKKAEIIALELGIISKTEQAPSSQEPTWPVRISRSIQAESASLVPASDSLAITRPIQVRPPGQVKKTEYNPAYWWVVLSFYLAGIVLAEALTTLVAPALGMICHAFLLAGLFAHGALSRHSISQRMLVTLALAPLIRILSLSLPPNDYIFYFNYLLAGAPLLLSAVLVVRVTGFQLEEVGLRLSGWPVQLLVGLTGIGFGYVEFLILHPKPLVSAITLAQVWLPALILLIFTGFLEEFIFRGLMLKAFADGMGKLSGIVYISVVFTVMQLGNRSALQMLFVFAVALFFGWMALRTRSILGVTLAHGLTNVCLFLVFPFLVS